jgi:hypothetical protein
VWHQQPIFPTYLFITLDIDDRERWPRINRTAEESSLGKTHFGVR